MLNKKRSLAIINYLPVLFLLILFTSCSAPKQLDPAVKAQGEKVFSAIKDASQNYGNGFNERGTQYKDIGAYVPAQISVETNESGQSLISSVDFSVSPDGEGDTYYGIEDLSRGDYRANKYAKYFTFYTGDASGRIREVAVKVKYRYLVQELSGGAPDGKEEYSDWDDEWSTDEQATVDYLNSVRKLLNKPTCNNVDELNCK